MIKKVLIMGFLFTLFSCSTTVKFPVSDAVPAANFTVKKKKDKHNNNLVEVYGENLASPNRLNPPGNYYSVWILTKQYGVLNVGQLNVKNGKKATLKAVTPFDFDSIFITVEKDGNLQYPTGTEISRTQI